LYFFSEQTAVSPFAVIRPATLSIAKKESQPFLNRQKKENAPRNQLEINE